MACQKKKQRKADRLATSGSIPTSAQGCSALHKQVHGLSKRNKKKEGPFKCNQKDVIAWQTAKPWRVYQVLTVTGVRLQRGTVCKRDEAPEFPQMKGNKKDCTSNGDGCFSRLLLLLLFSNAKRGRTSRETARPCGRPGASGVHLPHSRETSRLQMPDGHTFFCHLSTHSLTLFLILAEQILIFNLFQILNGISLQFKAHFFF